MPARRLSGQREHRRCLNFRFLPVPLLRLPAHRSADPHEFNPHEGEKSMSSDHVDTYRTNKMYAHQTSLAARAKERAPVKHDPVTAVTRRYLAQEEPINKADREETLKYDAETERLRARNPWGGNDSARVKGREALLESHKTKRADRRARYLQEKSDAMKRNPAP
jgi:hypothetical protein